MDMGKVLGWPIICADYDGSMPEHDTGMQRAGWAEP